MQNIWEWIWQNDDISEEEHNRIVEGSEYEVRSHFCAHFVHHRIDFLVATGRIKYSIPFEGHSS